MTTTPVAPHPPRHPRGPARGPAARRRRGDPPHRRRASASARRPTSSSTLRSPTVAGVEASAAGDASDGPDSAAAGCELVCVLGGDGTILRGAELSRGSGVPLLGVNLGHVGFLAEAEREDLDATVERIVSRDYTVEERMTLEVHAFEDGHQRVLVVGAERGDRREGLPRADARAHRRHRRAPAVDVGLRRHRHGDAHRLHRLRVLGRRPGRLARRRGAAPRADQRARPLRPAGGRRPAVPPRRRGAGPHPGQRASCGATAAAPSTCRRAPASRCTAPSSRCGWPACRTAASPTGSSRSSASRCRAGAAPPAR